MSDKTVLITVSDEVAPKYEFTGNWNGRSVKIASNHLRREYKMYLSAKLRAEEEEMLREWTEFYKGYQETEKLKEKENDRTTNRPVESGKYKRGSTSTSGGKSKR